MPQSVEEDFNRNNAISLIWLIWSRPSKRTRAGGYEIYNFGRPFLCHHYFTLSLSEPCLWVEKKIFKEIHQFYTYYTKITSPWGRVGVMQSTISCLFTLQMLHVHIKFGSDWPSSSWEEGANARRTTDANSYSNRSHELLRWPNKKKYLIHSNTRIFFKNNLQSAL